MRDVDGTYERYFSEHRIVALLMRPDFVVYGVARSADELAALVDGLRISLH
jgi:hypothetical protein